MKKKQIANKKKLVLEMRIVADLTGVSGGRPIQDPSLAGPATSCICPPPG
jgi:hypothetical protein